LGESLLSGLQMAIFSSNLHMVKERKRGKSSSASFYKDTNSIHEGFAVMT
jgi:hypothetical protein